MAAKKAAPYGGAVAAARQQARASGARPKQVQQAAQQARQSYQAPQPTPQPPAAQDPGTAGGFQYNPSMESQLNQPYQDVMAAGNLGQLPNQYARMDQQNQMGGIYGQGSATNLGGAQQGMGQLQPLAGQSLGLGQGSLGQYGQLLQPNQNIQQGLANQIQSIQAGNLYADPAMVQQIGQQQQQLQAQLQRQLGPDWATSSAGIEAMNRFQQGANTTLGSENYNQLQGLVGLQQGGLQNLSNQGVGLGTFGQGVQGQQFNQGAQLGTMYGQNNMDLYNQNQGMRQSQLTGAGQMLQNTGATQQLYANIPQTMGQFGQAMSGQSGAAVQAQGPYQSDRFGQFQAAQMPTGGQAWGQALQNSGNRWISAASSMGGGGGGAPSSSSSSSFNPNGAQFQE